MSAQPNAEEKMLEMEKMTKHECLGWCTVSMEIICLAWLKSWMPTLMSCVLLSKFLIKMCKNWNSLFRPTQMWVLFYVYIFKAHHLDATVRAVTR